MACQCARSASGVMKVSDTSNLVLGIPMVALVCNAPTPNAQIPTPKVPRPWELEVGSWQLFESQALLSPRNWIDTREREQINHVEGLPRPAWQCGAPSLREVGRVIELQQADDHFADELRADACQSQAIR